MSSGPNGDSAAPGNGGRPSARYWISADDAVARIRMAYPLVPYEWVLAQFVSSETTDGGRYDPSALPRIAALAAQYKEPEFWTLDEVLKELRVDETKLKRLVSEGEIRAFREGDQMKFRRSDVRNLDLTGSRGEEETGVIDLSAGKKGDEVDDAFDTDELVFKQEDDLGPVDIKASATSAPASSSIPVVAVSSVPGKPAASSMSAPEAPSSPAPASPAAPAAPAVAASSAVPAGTSPAAPAGVSSHVSSVPVPVSSGPSSTSHPAGGVAASAPKAPATPVPAVPALPPPPVVAAAPAPKPAAPAASRSPTPASTASPATPTDVVRKSDLDKVVKDLKAEIAKPPAGMPTAGDIKRAVDDATRDVVRTPAVADVVSRSLTSMLDRAIERRITDGEIVSSRELDAATHDKVNAADLAGEVDVAVTKKVRAGDLATHADVQALRNRIPGTGWLWATTVLALIAAAVALFFPSASSGGLSMEEVNAALAEKTKPLEERMLVVSQRSDRSEQTFGHNAEAIRKLGMDLAKAEGDVGDLKPRVKKLEETVREIPSQIKSDMDGLEKRLLAALSAHQHASTSAATVPVTPAPMAVTPTPAVPSTITPTVVPATQCAPQSPISPATKQSGQAVDQLVRDQANGLAGVVNGLDDRVEKLEKQQGSNPTPGNGFNDGAFTLLCSAVEGDLYTLAAAHVKTLRRDFTGTSDEFAKFLESKGADQKTLNWYRSNYCKPKP